VKPAKFQVNEWILAFFAYLRDDYPRAQFAPGGKWLWPKEGTQEQ
jgi:hypothetical protein